MQDLAVARVRRESDNTKVRVIDLLKTVIADIESGEAKAEAVLVLTGDFPDGEEWTFETYRAGVTKERELMMLRLAEHRWMTNTITSD